MMANPLDSERAGQRDISYESLGAHSMPDAISALLSQDSLRYEDPSKSSLGEQSTGVSWL